jgi:cobalt-zinc-cadmium efflux system membrane fusion protein
MAPFRSCSRGWTPRPAPLSHTLRRAGLAAGAIVALAAGASGLAGCRRANATTVAADAKPARVTVAQVRQDEVRRAVDVVGTLAAFEQVTVSSEVEGKVVKILADLGDRVTAGQPLVELDPEKLQYHLAQQRAALDRAMAKYGVADANAAGDLPAIERTPDVQKAAAELAQAEQNHKRAVELQQRKLIPQQQLDDADAALLTRRAGYEAALQGARNLRADIAAERANLQLAQRDVRDGVIRAPFDAYVERRLVSPGEFVRLQTPVMALVKVDPLKLTAEIPERVAPWVKIGQQLSLTVEAFPDQTHDGTIARISPAANPQTRAFPLEGRVPNADRALKPGTFARVHIVTDRVERILTVPAAALQYRYGVNRVFVVTGDHLQSKEIKIGDRLGERVEVVDGVAAGESIVSANVDTLADGARVTVGGGE